MAFLGVDASVADVLLSSVSSGEVRVNLGDLSDGTGFGAECSLWGVDGFVSCPNDPDDAGCAQAIYLSSGNSKRAICSRDVRFASKAGALKPGDRAILSDCDARLFLKKANNGITLYTVNETDGDKAMIVDLAGAKGKITILNSGAQIAIEKDKITLGVSGGGAIVIDSNGVQVLGQQFVAACSTVTLGLIAGVPPPPGLTSALIGVSGMAGIASKSVTIAP